MFSKNISVDAGALCSNQNNQFGNYTFSLNLIQSLSRYDKKNTYTLYSFCSKSKQIKTTKNISFKKIVPRIFWSKIRIGIEELVNRRDIYLALNQSLPFATFAKTISFSHGLSFRFFPGLYKNFDHLHDQLEEYTAVSDRIIVSSSRVKNEMAELFPKIEDRIISIPFGIPFDMGINSKKESPQNYFIHVGQDHPIKNTAFVVNAFKRFKKNRKYKRFKLYLIGYTQKTDNNDIIAVSHLSRQSLKSMYRKATALLTSSFYESFNIPVLEALSQKTQVIGLRSAIIPEMRGLVRVADEEEEFIELMKRSIEKPIKPKKDISLAFSWKKYVEELNNAYQTLI